MVQEKEIIKTLQKFSGKYSQYTVFMDWVACMAISIQNACTFLLKEVYQDRERQYLDIIGKYNPSEQQCFTEMFAMLISRMQEGEMDDVLGSIYIICSPDAEIKVQDSFLHRSIFLWPVRSL